jgi:hypothetical protein
MSDQIGDVSEDGFWVLTETGWQATDKQEQALNDGAIPHDNIEAIEPLESAPQMITIATSESGLSNKEKIDNPIYSYFVIGVLAFALLLQIFGMHMGSWTNSNAYDSSEDPEWLENAEGGIGLTHIYFDCSDVSGTDDETGEKNKDMCKFAGGMLTGEISMYKIATASSVTELTDDLPDEMSGSVSEMCEVMKELEGEAEEISSCEDRSSAGSTSIVLFWISFVSGLMAVVFGALGIFNKLDNSKSYQKYALTTSAAFGLLGMVVWLVMAPVFGDSSIPFGAGYYLTLLSVLLLITMAVVVWLKSLKPRDTIVF